MLSLPLPLKAYHPYPSHKHCDWLRFRKSQLYIVDCSTLILLLKLCRYSQYLDPVTEIVIVVQPVLKRLLFARYNHLFLAYTNDMSHVMRKSVYAMCEQQRHRPALASASVTIARMEVNDSVSFETLTYELNYRLNNCVVIIVIFSYSQLWLRISYDYHVDL